MKKIKTKNGVYYGLTHDEIIWLTDNERHLPQIEDKKNIIYLNPKKMEALLDLRDKTN